MSAAPRQRRGRSRLGHDDEKSSLLSPYKTGGGVSYEEAVAMTKKAAKQKADPRKQEAKKAAKQKADLKAKATAKQKADNKAKAKQKKERQRKKREDAIKQQLEDSEAQSVFT